MKKIKILFAMLLVACFTIQAQEDETSYLPEAGDFAIGADAYPVFNFVGNLFNGAGLAGANALNLQAPIIYGKYYLDENTAIRSILCVATNDAANAFYAIDDAALALDPLSNAQVVDVQNIMTEAYFLSVGYQKFIGEKRLRGFLGGQLYGNYTSTVISYEYGNPMTSTNQLPTVGTASYIGTARLLEANVAPTLQIGLGAIAGFEYYVLPKLCIGGEVSLNLIYRNAGQTYTKSEQYISGSTSSQVDVAVTPGSSSFQVQTQRFNAEAIPAQHAGLYVMFHF